MTTADRPVDHSVELPLTEAAQALGLTREALRSRLRRGLVKGRSEGGHWLVTLPGHDHGQDDHVDRPAPITPANDYAGELVELRTRLAAVEGERDWLRAEVERRGVELSEMRRLLGNAQQQLAAVLAPAAQLPPAQNVTTQAERPENASGAAEPVQTAPAPARGFWARLFGR